MGRSRSRAQRRDAAARRTATPVCKQKEPEAKVVPKERAATPPVVPAFRVEDWFIVECLKWGSQPNGSIAYDHGDLFYISGLVSVNGHRVRMRFHADQNVEYYEGDVATLSRLEDLSANQYYGAIEGDRYTIELGAQHADPYRLIDPRIIL